MTYPLVARLTTHVPMPAYLQPEPWRHVYWFMLWTLWLAKQGVAVWPVGLTTDLVFYPIGVAIPSAVQTISTAVFAVPMQSLLGIVAVGNILLLAAMALAGYGAFLLARYITGHVGASLLAGMIYCCSPIVLANLQGHLYVITGLPWIPLYLLSLLKTLDRGRTPTALAAAAFFCAAMLSYWYDAAFLVVFTSVIVLLRTIRTPSDLRRWIAPAFTLVGVVTPVALALLAPFLLSATRALPVPPLQSVLSEMQDWSVDLLAFFIPAYDHWLFGARVRALRGGFGGNFTLQTAFLGYTPLALAALALAGGARPAARLWAWCAAVFFTLALGPWLHVDGVDRFTMFGRAFSVPLPQRLVASLPPLSGVRDLSIYVVPLMLCVALLAAIGLHRLASRRRAKTAAIVTMSAMALVVAEFAVLPFPVADARMPAVYDVIARDAAPATVLELPWSTTIPVYQYYQTVHGKPLIGGYLNRLPPWYERFADAFPLVAQLKGAPSGGADDAHDQTGFLRFFRIRYVVIHRDIAGDAEFQRLSVLVRTALSARPIAEDRGAALYRIDRPPAAARLPIVVDFSPEERGYTVALGWSSHERREGVTAAWAERTISSVWSDLPPSHAVTVSIRVQPFVFAGAPPQTVRLSVNGHVVNRASLPEGWSVQTFRVPGAVLLDGVNRFDFEYAHCQVPADVVSGSNDHRCLAVAFDELRIE